ncbi:MAG TPA: glutathione peroxidase [Chitinophagaceae bacterium]|nr:glutathione peroxidase [Chitinophagaceae bacterium]
MKKLLLISGAFIIVFILYITLSNWNMEMSFRQKILKAAYPVFTALNRLTGAHAQVRTNEQGTQPLSPVFQIPIVMNDGSTKTLADFSGRKIMIVNTASDCGYTHQFDDLQKLYEASGERLVIIGFPSNDFKEQEKGTDSEIEAFCRMNYGVTFPLARKSQVRKGAGQHPIYQWLSSKEQNGWNSKSPSWNFSKYLINEKGVLTHYFDPAVDPTGSEVMNAIQL